MTEAVTEVERLTHELNVANNKLDAQAQKMKDMYACLGYFHYSLFH
jgi:hypothetical protein